jgi:hypothetical protein
MKLRCVMGALWLAGLSSQAGAQAIFSCDDVKGRRVTADRPIAECLDREQKELNPSGTVKRRIAPVPTAKERAAEEARAQQALEEKRRLAEEKKRDLVLLARYPDQAAHDKVRASTIAMAREVIATANQRTRELLVERKGLDLQMEFYQKDPSKAPVALKRQIEENERQIVVQERFVASQDSERQRIDARFDEELVALKRLWAQAGQSTTSAAAVTTAPVKASGPAAKSSAAAKR